MIAGGSPGPARRCDEAPIRLLLVAEHLVVRAGLKAVLGEADDLAIVGEVQRAIDLPELLEQFAPDLVIFDPDPRPEPWVSFVPDAASARFLVLTGARSPGRHQEVLRSGARGLVPKDAPVEVLLKAIRRVHRGELWFERELLASWHAPRSAGLTAREREIVTLISEGLRNEQIAERMGVAEKTVRNRLSSVFDKIGVSDRLGLAVYAYQHGLVRTPA